MKIIKAGRLIRCKWSSVGYPRTHVTGVLESNTRDLDHCFLFLCSNIISEVRTRIKGPEVILLQCLKA